MHTPHFNSQDVARYLEQVNLPSLKHQLLVSTRLELCKRPLLLKLITKLFASTDETNIPDKEEELIDEAIDHLLVDYRNSLNETDIPSERWRVFLEYVALQMYVQGTRFMERGVIDELVRQFFSQSVDPDSLPSTFTDARVRTLFDMDERGLVFAHFAFRDFLAACAIAKKLLSPKNEDKALHNLALTSEMLTFIQYATSKYRDDYQGLQYIIKPSAEPPAFQFQAERAYLRWCWIPPGLGIVGEPGFGSAEKNRARLIFFDRGFWVSQTPITIRDYRDACQEVFQEPNYFDLYIRVKDLQRPLTNVTHKKAHEICTELFGGRLPTEEEWERAVRWIDGSCPQTMHIEFISGNPVFPPKVGRGVANPWSVKNGTGCVWQWTSTKDDLRNQFICKGAWWGASEAEKLNAAIRLVPTELAHIRTGFRVVIPDDGGLS